MACCSTKQTFRVRCTFLDHRIPCLAFALEEKNHVNIMKNRLAELGLPVGQMADRTEAGRAAGRAVIHCLSGCGGAKRGRSSSVTCRWGILKRDILRIVPGQKIAYVTDAVYSPENAEKIILLARNADLSLHRGDLSA